MVRTRSGKTTNEAEKAKKGEKVDVKQKKVTIKSPKKAGKERIGWTYKILTDLCFWKPTDKTFTFWSCLKGLIILLIAGYSVYDQFDTKYPDFYFYELVLFIHGFDIATNFCNELLQNGHLNDFILFTEGAVNLSEIFTFLFMMNKATNLWITTVSVITFNILALNIFYKNEESILYRIMAYFALFLSFIMNVEFVLNHIRISTYFSFIFASMIFDAFDFPDKYIKKSKMCEGLVILSRSVAVYMLITSSLLFNQGNQFTNFESTIKSFIGM